MSETQKIVVARCTHCSDRQDSTYHWPAECLLLIQAKESIEGGLCVPRGCVFNDDVKVVWEILEQD